MAKQMGQKCQVGSDGQPLDGQEQKVAFLRKSVGQAPPKLNSTPTAKAKPDSTANTANIPMKTRTKGRVGKK